MAITARNLPKERGDSAPARDEGQRMFEWTDGTVASSSKRSPEQGVLFPLPRFPSDLSHLPPFLEDIFGPPGSTRLNLANIDYIPAQVAYVLERRSKPNEGFLVLAPTGTGKTYMFSAAVDLEVARGEKVIIVVPNDNLARQHLDKMSQIFSLPPEAFSLRTGAIPAANRSLIQAESLQQIVIGTPGALLNDLRDEKIKINDFKVVVLDEFQNFRGDEDYKRLALLCVRAGLVPLAFTDMSADNLNLTNAQLKEIGIQNLRKVNVPPNEIWINRKKVTLVNEFETARQILKDAVVDIGRELYGTLTTIDPAATIKELRNEKVEAARRARQANDQINLLRSSLAGGIAGNETPGVAKNIRKQLRKLEHAERKAQNKVGEIDSAIKEVDTLPQKLISMFTDPEKARTFSNDSLQERNRVARVPPAGQLNTFHDTVFGAGIKIDESFRTGWAQTLSLTSELGYLRHLYSALTTMGRFSFLENCGRKMWKMRFMSEKCHGWEKRTVTRPAIRNAFSLMSSGTPYFDLLGTSSKEDLLSKYGIKEESKLTRQKSGGFPMVELKKRLSSSGEKFMGLCREFLVTSPLSEHPSEEVILTDFKGSGYRRTEKYLIHVEDTREAAFITARLNHHLGHLGWKANWYASYGGKKVLEKRLESFSSPEPRSINILVATSKINQGYDNPYLFTVYAYSVPDELRDFRQLRGRAGRRRDLNQRSERAGSFCVLVTEDTEAVPRLRAMVAKDRRLEREYRELQELTHI